MEPDSREVIPKAQSRQPRAIGSEVTWAHEQVNLEESLLSKCECRSQASSTNPILK